jgi:SAM-dependent methyltransferase
MPAAWDEMVARLRRGEPVSDREFDALLPSWARRSSDTHWTPIDVARRAAELLAPAERVLDVGSGAGKFCLVAALCRPAAYVGVEQRGHLVELSRNLVAAFGVERVRFVHGNVESFEMGGFDGFYLYNPFAENLASLVSTPVDQDVARDPRLLDRYVEVVRRGLAAAAAGTRVVTYHGFGGQMPEGYALEAREDAETDVLELWVKTS